MGDNFYQNVSGLTLPAFIGHGSPMNAIESNQYTQAWTQFGLGRPKPRAVLSISAHWYINSTMVTAMHVPRTIHDFYGFPPELFNFEYQTKGDPTIANEVIEAVSPTKVDPDLESWGIDHGTWSVLCHVFPDADVPVLQLSIDASAPIGFHFDLGRKLAPLSEKGILVLGSGNVVHNLRRIDWSLPDDGFDWAHQFNNEVIEVMTNDVSKVLEMPRHQSFTLASPTPDHFLPLVYIAGMLHEIGVSAKTFVNGYAYGSLSMAAFSA